MAKPILGPLKPLIAAEINEDAGFFAGTGVYMDLFPTDKIYIKPSFIAGLYEDGNSKDLGDGAIFRSQLEVGYEFSSGHRLGLAFSHLSNGWQDKDNAGTEILSLYLHCPTNSLFSRKNNGVTTLPMK